MPMIVFPSVAMNSSGAYVASRAMVKEPLLLMAAGTVAAIEEFSVWVGMALDPELALVVVVALLELLLHAAASNPTAMSAVAQLAFRNPRLVFIYLPPLKVDPGWCLTRVIHNA